MLGGLVPLGVGGFEFGSSFDFGSDSGTAETFADSVRINSSY